MTLRSLALAAAALLAGCPATPRPGLSPCGTGTTDVGGTCQSTLSCGEGTTLQGDSCVSTGGGGSLCGTDTTLDGDSCVGVVTCGSGTTRDGNTCKPSGSTLTCGSGTTQNGNQCVPSGTTLTCGSGTTQSGNQCVASGATVTCGAGTTLSGSQCVASGGTLTCGAGTMQSGNQCLPGTPSNTTITQFLASQVTTFGMDVGPSLYEYELFTTNLDDTQARAYLSVDAAPIGGPFDALFIKAGARGSALPYRPDVYTFAIRAPPTCTLAALRELPASSTDVFIGFVRDFGGTAVATCANGGSLTLGYDNLGKFVAIFTTQFSDGTVLTNKEIVGTRP